MAHHQKQYLLVFASLLYTGLLFRLGSAGDPEAKRLYDDLLSNYNRLIRPVLNDNETLKVRLGLKLAQIVDVVSTTHFYYCVTFLKLSFLPFFFFPCMQNYFEYFFILLVIVFFCLSSPFKRGLMLHVRFVLKHEWEDEGESRLSFTLSIRLVPLKWHENFYKLHSKLSLY